MADLYILDAPYRKIPATGFPAAVFATFPASLPSLPPCLFASPQLPSLLQCLASFYTAFSPQSGLDIQINCHLGWVNLHTRPDWLVSVACGCSEGIAICMFLFY